MGEQGPRENFWEIQYEGMKRCTVIELIGIDYKLRYPPPIFKFPSVFVPGLSFASLVLRNFWGLIDIYYWLIGSLKTTQGTGQNLEAKFPSVFVPGLSFASPVLRFFWEIVEIYYWRIGSLETTQGTGQKSLSYVHISELFNFFCRCRANWVKVVTLGRLLLVTQNVA